MKTTLKGLLLLAVLLVSTAHAAIDIATAQKLLASDGAASDQFGVSVSVDGDTAVIGANWSDTAKGVDSGSAYIFVRENGVWKEKQKLTASEGSSEYLFGSVSISGDTVLIGSNWDDAKGEKSGAAYVFVRAVDGTWTQQAKLTASDGAGWDVFGDRVALDGDTALIGAWGDDDKGDISGSAYVFVRSSDGTWSQKQKLTASDGAAGNSFGYPVSLHDGIMLVGAENDSNKGAAYVFVRDATNDTWTQEAKLVADDGAAGDYFGHSIAVNGNTALIGAMADDDKGADSGSVYVFVRAANGTWSKQAKLLADDGAAGDKFCVVSLHGNRALIGAPGKNSISGTAYVFVRGQDDTWSQQQKLTASDGTANDAFGVAVSLDGSTALIGARGLLGTSNTGAAYVYNTPVNMSPIYKLLL
ncbi:FG-GAP repeat protein [Candidatus Electronema sp. JM]|uniref:FG-GAP repeat protein n=1 Tax=Candidatus Electronema sp. JM TaxID=3401571 RepID=UPI003AA7E470